MKKNEELRAARKDKLKEMALTPSNKAGDIVKELKIQTYESGGLNQNSPMVKNWLESLTKGKLLQLTYLNRHRPEMKTKHQGEAYDCR